MKRSIDLNSGFGSPEAGIKLPNNKCRVIQLHILLGFVILTLNNIIQCLPRNCMYSTCMYIEVRLELYLGFYVLHFQLVQVHFAFC